MRPPLAPDGLPVGMPDQHGIATIGWDVLWWAEEYLAQPDSVNAGEPWRWTETERLVAGIQDGSLRHDGNGRVW